MKLFYWTRVELSDFHKSSLIFISFNLPVEAVKIKPVNFETFG